MFDISKLQWTPEPLPCKIEAGRIAVFSDMDYQELSDD